MQPIYEDIAVKLVFANAAINPILYGVFNANYRRAYLYYAKLLGFILSCKMTGKPRPQRRRSSAYPMSAGF